MKRRLPKVLTMGQIGDLLEIPDGRTPFRLRDRAILGLLNSAGLRVSELCSLNIGKIDFDRGIARVIGKGDKERVIFIGNSAIEALKNYLKVRRHFKPKDNALFLNRMGRMLSTREVRLTLDK